MKNDKYEMRDIANSNVKLSLIVCGVSLILASLCAYQYDPFFLVLVSMVFPLGTILYTDQLDRVYEATARIMASDYIWQAQEDAI